MPKKYVLYQGKLDGKSIGSTLKKSVVARGPITAAKAMFPGVGIRKVGSREIFGSNGTQFGIVGGKMVYNGRPGRQPDNWVQINEVDGKNESHYFVLERGR